MKALVGTFALFENSLETAIIINAILAIFLGASMKRLWSLINTL